MTKENNHGPLGVVGNFECDGCGQEHIAMNGQSNGDWFCPDCDEAREQHGRETEHDE
jgi:hypothetical protein